jgi:hypothetical protein
MTRRPFASTKSAVSPSAIDCSTKPIAPSSPIRAVRIHSTRSPGLPGLRRGTRRALRARRGHAGHERPTHRGQRHGVPRGLLDPLPRDLVAHRVAALPLRERTRRRDRRRRGAEGQGQATTFASWPRPATAGRSTSASGASRACSSATTTCSSSATTTRPI